MFELALTALPRLQPPSWVTADLTVTLERGVRRGLCPADRDGPRPPPARTFPARAREPAQSAGRNPLDPHPAGPAGGAHLPAPPPVPAGPAGTAAPPTAGTSMTVTEPGPLPGGRPADASTGALDGEALRTRVAGLLERARARTRGLTDAVDEADLVTQHSPLMSPLVWDLAHVGSQEELWLVRDVGGREPLRPEIDGLYDAFQHSRASQVELPLLGPAETRAYVAEVRERRSTRSPPARCAAGGWWSRASPSE